MNKNKSTLSIIIPCRMSKLTYSFFEKLLKIQLECHETILIDNGSTDETSQIIENFKK